MPALSRAQRIAVATLATFGLIYVGILIAGPVLEYLHGPSPETVLLRRLSDIGPMVFFAIAAFVLILQRIGVLPAAKAGLSQDYQFSPVRRLRNLALWIVIALLLVFLFNLFQSPGNARVPMHSVSSSSDPLINLLINWFPMLLIFGVWLFFLRQMKLNKGRQPTDPPNP